MIQWNTYHLNSGWWSEALNARLEQILVPLLQCHLQHVEGFIGKHAFVFWKAQVLGVSYYHALKVCEKNKHLAHDSGLGVRIHRLTHCDEFERRVWLWRRRVIIGMVTSDGVK